MSLTLKQHAEKAYRIQDACNAHGVAISLTGWFDDYSVLYPSYSTDQKNRHPITRLYVDKLSHLASTQNLDDPNTMSAYLAVSKLMEGDDDAPG